MVKKIKIKKLTEVENLKERLARETMRANNNFEVANRNELIVKKIEALFPYSSRPTYMVPLREGETTLFDRVLNVITENARLHGEIDVHLGAVKLMKDVVRWHINPTMVEKRPDETMGEKDFFRNRNHNN